MKKVAILQFPGLNSEQETKRAVDDAGMEGVIFRWNEDPTKLTEFDGYIVPGGFSYEDRGRAGLIASLDSVMDIIRSEVAKGKPLLGICNGAQVVIETGLVPGTGKLELCLANNKRIKDGEVIGTGFINFDKELTSTAKQGRSAFNIGIEKGGHFMAPIAHGEGRFTAQNLDTIIHIESNDQIIFKYCDKDGNVEDNYPVNPNGAFKNAAAISNVAGNVMAIMPHPERGFYAPMPEIFHSMKVYLEEYMGTEKAMIPTTSVHTKSELSLADLQTYGTKNNDYFEIFVDLIITDNTAETYANTLNQLGFEVEINRSTHFTVYTANDSDSSIEAKKVLASELIQSGELLNLNKEIARVKIDGTMYKFSPDDATLHEITTHSDSSTIASDSNQLYRFYTKDREDFFGQNKSEKIKKHSQLKGFDFITQGTVWNVIMLDSTDPESRKSQLEKLLQTNILANQNSMELKLYS